MQRTSKGKTVVKSDIVRELVEHVRVHGEYPYIAAFRAAHESALDDIDDLVAEAELEIESDRYRPKIVTIARHAPDVADEEIKLAQRILEGLRALYREARPTGRNPSVNAASLTLKLAMYVSDVRRGLTHLYELPIYGGTTRAPSGLLEEVQVLEGAVRTPSLAEWVAQRLADDQEREVTGKKSGENTITGIAQMGDGDGNSVTGEPRLLDSDRLYCRLAEGTQVHLAVLNLDVDEGSARVESGDAKQHGREFGEMRAAVERICGARCALIGAWSGDGVQAWFESATDAMLAAIEIQCDSSLSSWRLRIGVHIGAVPFSIRTGEVTHDTLNVAGHLQKECPPGGVLVSDVLRQHLTENARHLFRRRVKVTHGQKKVAAYQLSSAQPRRGRGNFAVATVLGAALGWIVAQQTPILVDTADFRPPGLVFCGIDKTLIGPVTVPHDEVIHKPIDALGRICEHFAAVGPAKNRQDGGVPHAVGRVRVYDPDANELSEGETIAKHRFVFVADDTFAGGSTLLKSMLFRISLTVDSALAQQRTGASR